jgi:transglutaminase-like putative cysteine protease
MRTSWGMLLVIGLVVSAGARGQGDADKSAGKLFASAQGLLKEGKADEALGAIKKALELEPKNEGYLLFASNAARIASKFAEGIQFAQQAVKLNDQSAVAHALVAFNAVKDHDLDLCRAACKKALALSPQSLDAEGYRELVLLNELVGVRKLKFSWPLNPRKGVARQGSYPVVVPPEKIKGQAATYEVTGAKSFKTVTQGLNSVLLLVPAASQTIDLVLNVTVDPYSYKSDLENYKKMALPATVQPFLGPSEAINPKSATLKKIVKDLKDDNPITTVKNILAWQKKHLKYTYDEKATNKADFTSVDQVVERGEGECRAWSTLFCGLCRAAGVPARHFWGLVLIVPDAKNPKGSISGHVWAEVYITGAGWVPVDPQDASLFGFLPNTYVRIFTDMSRGKSSVDNLPLFNLLSMGREGFRFEAVR